VSQAPYMSWTVLLAGHVVGSPRKVHRRWEIPEQEIVAQGRDREEAVRAAVKQAHVRARVAPWRPYEEQSLRFVRSAALAPLTALQEKQAAIREKGTKR
jgi:hypothetical protein